MRERLPLYDLAGRRFGRLAVMTYVPSARWLCRCDCGVEKVITSGALRRGYTNSCGCLRRETMRKLRTKHGGASTPTYRVWLGMKQRCDNPNEKFYAHYGGRGIVVCKRWQKFENFLADMGPKPDGAHSIDRKDNNGDYKPSNCRWSTWVEQANNKRNNRVLEYQGRRQTVSEWARELGLKASTLHRRLGIGWSAADVLTRPKFGMVAFDGRVQSIHDWAKEVGISAGTIYKRLQYGWPMDKALTATRQDNSPKKLTFRGRTKSLGAWARELGMRPAVIHTRIYRGWPVAKALSTPVR